MQISPTSRELSIGINCKSRLVEDIVIEPQSPWSLEMAFAEFGSGYCYHRYFVVDDPNEKEQNPELRSGLLREDPRGTFVKIEYPSKGLVLIPDSYDRIRLAVYSGEPDD